MPETIYELPAFFRRIEELLTIIENSREVLFRKAFRENLPPAIQEAIRRLRYARDLFHDPSPDLRAGLELAGLAGPNLQLKLESFNHADTVFQDEGTEKYMEQTLDVASIILGSVAGAIPLIGSLVKELLDAILKELKRRWW